MQTYTYEQVREASVKYFSGDTMAAENFAGKYALQDLQGNFYELTPEDMHRRLAREFARVELKYPNPMSEKEIFDLLKDWSVVPQGGPMAGIGNPFQLQSLSNCFVVDSAQDSYAGIMFTDQEQVQIMKRRGGVGHDISNIRPKGLPAANAARTTDGIGVFMQRFSNTTREVAQGGRRGALMLTISVHHPEIMTFIKIKRDRKLVTGANVSIRCTDEFMRAVREDQQYEQRWPVDAKKPVISKMVSARDIWNEMMQSAWDSAEPGVLFWDTIIRGSPADCYVTNGYRTISTNPCGELPLPPYDSCRLLLTNVFRFIKDAFLKGASFDESRFRAAAFKAQRLMDDLIDLELEQIDRIIEKIRSDKERLEVRQIEIELWNKIKMTTQNGRRTGLGLTGLGDAIAALGMKYDSEEAERFVSKVYRALGVESYHSSIVMALERGAFPVYHRENEKDHVFVKKMLAEIEADYPDDQITAMYYATGRRNIANLTTSPAGTLSTQTQTTSGIEPAIFLEYVRRKKITTADKVASVDFVDDLGDKWTEYSVFHHGHLEWAKVNDKDPRKDKEESPYFGATAEEIDPLQKIRLQAAAQQWIDHSISNTTNLPEDVTVDQVSQIYMKGWELGCKGVTVYRKNSRSGVLVEAGSEEKKKDGSKVIQDVTCPPRPSSMPCDIHKAKIKGVDHVIVVGLLEGRPYEIFLGEKGEVPTGRGLIWRTVNRNMETVYDLHVENQIFLDILGTFNNESYGAFTRILSASLRYGIPISVIVEQLRKDKHSNIYSFSSVVARLLAKHYVKDGTKTTSREKCQDCGSQSLAYLQGCVSCLDCGSSKCS